MATSQTTVPSPPSPARTPLRVQLHEQIGTGLPDGAWWPHSRDLQTEAADLLDHFPAEVGRIQRLMFSRPDWDNCTHDGRGLRRIAAARGQVKVGSFPHDDTHLMVLVLFTGQRLNLTVIPFDTPCEEAQRLLDDVTTSAAPPSGTDHAH